MATSTWAFHRIGFWTDLSFLPDGSTDHLHCVEVPVLAGELILVIANNSPTVSFDLARGHGVPFSTSASRKPPPVVSTAGFNSK